MDRLRIIKFIIALGHLCILSQFVYCEDKLYLDVSSYHPNQNEYNVFKRYFDIKNNTTIYIDNIQNDVGFFIIQIHTYIENVTLSNDYNLNYGSYVTGTNIGLYSQSKNNSAVFYLFRNNKISDSLQSLIVLNIYDATDPIPGGCNLSFGTTVAPYQSIQYTDSMIKVNSQPPSYNGISCVNNSIQTNMFHMFLNDYDNSMESYFNGLEKVLTVDGILKYGRKVPDTLSTGKFSRLYSSYIGTGEIFAIITNYNNRSSVYVPAVSYGCDVSQWKESCLGPVSVHWKFLCAVQLIFGVFICFFGHRFFKITVYVVSFTFGLLVTYFIISMEEYLSITEKTITSFTVGFIYGIIWLLIWKTYGLPFLTINLALIMSGFLTASLFFYTILTDMNLFMTTFNYWMVFLLIIILCIIVSIPNATYAHIASLSYLSSYSCVMALSYYVGGNLPYILINTYRRVAVLDFNLAVIDPPMDTIDILHVLLWIGLLLFGMFIQIRHQRGKPPFPPNRRFLDIIENPRETTPLIHDIFAPRQYTMMANGPYNVVKTSRFYRM
ncbi:transmembrane 7 superfamily member 3-like isoform X1 [Diorhabda sublineata]|uniref:transmembrane 7 superfamily member 3-like isoform X1 n=2 Tax=Diorhabda sublineata TaxID=1163346 RepID=UPI0024E1951D|nr:transmembrane 7 superfamily member 3-like isoform X1 [Diorhabda sublineata]